MPRFPVVSGEDAIAKLERVGYRVVRQRGSHVRLFNPDSTKCSITVPLHSELKRGLLARIIKDAGLTAQEFKSL